MTQLKAMMQAGESVPNAPTTRRFENYCSCGLHHLINLPMTSAAASMVTPTLSQAWIRYCEYI